MGTLNDKLTHIKTSVYEYNKFYFYMPIIQNLTKKNGGVML
jgi:hypothetical protein